MALDTNNYATEKIYEWSGSTPVVKAFNTVEAFNMLNPTINEQKVSMCMARSDEGSKNQVLQLVEDFGLAVIDAGDTYTSRFLDPLTNLWVHTAHILGKGQISPSISSGSN